MGRRSSSGPRASPTPFCRGEHREDGEGLEHCLHRELTKELGVQARVNAYLSGMEHRWTRSGARQYEINHCFSVAVSGLSAETAPSAREEHLSFTWAPADRLAAVALAPARCGTCSRPILERKRPGGRRRSYLVAPFREHRRVTLTDNNFLGEIWLVQGW